MTNVISVENLSKTYRLGQIGTGTFSRDLEVWWAKMRGKPNPMLRIGEKDHGNRDGEELWALRDVNFTVAQGEVLGIIGRNGAGKSTLLKILSRVTAPTSGKIKVKGRIASLLEVGTGFHPELTGRENIYLNGAIMGMSRKDIARRFAEIVDFAEVEKFIDTPVKRYSSGMYVRLAFAVAAHLEPEILVVDEVLAVGDAEFQKKSLGKMGAVAKEGRTVFFVSHNMAAITSLCSRVIYLNTGKLIKDGSASAIVQFYFSANSNSQAVSLAMRSDRQGSGLLWMTHVEILDTSTGNRIVQVYSGQNITLKIGYENNLTEPIRNGVCIIAFKSQFGQPLFACSTRVSNENLTLLSQRGKIVCAIPRFPLNEGVYQMDIMIKQGNDSTNILDSIEQAVQVQVVHGDFFGTGRSLPASPSPFLVDHAWEITSFDDHTRAVC